MTLSFRTRLDRIKSHWIFRYGLSVVLFAAVLGLSILLSYYATRINLTIPIVFALVAAAWYGGRGPGLLISVLFQTTTIIYIPIPPDSSIAKAIFGYFSVFALYVFLVLLISGLRRTQETIAEQRTWLRTTLTSIGDGVIATDREGNVSFMNPIAEQMTGWDERLAKGLPLEKIFNIINEDTREKVINPVATVLEKGAIVGLANHTILISKTGTEIPIEDSAAPIKNGDEIHGVVLVFADVTARRAVERARREAEIMQSIVKAQESERNRIARDLHDHLGQRMTALRLNLRALSDQCNGDAELAAAVSDVQAAALTIDRDIGFLSWELRPTELDSLGLENALASFVREWSGQYGIAAEFHGKVGDNNGGSRVPRAVEINLYRIVQEGLNNILKHADARNVTVMFQRRDGHAIVTIEDDGVGFDPSPDGVSKSKPGSLGLVGMHERAAILNGSVDVESETGQGTTVLVRVPIN